MAILRPNQLPPAVTPLSATDLVVVDQGAGGVNAADPQDVVDAAAPVVSQANAEAGLNNNDRMTALRTKQSIASEIGVTLASAAQGLLASTAVQPSRQVIAGAGLTGGGDLSSDKTFNVGAGTGITVNADDVALSATTISRLLPAAGTTSQVLQKASNTDYDVAWATVAAATAVSYAPQTLTSGEQLQARTNIGLGNVDNTSDANKPVSTATQTALNLKAPLASPALTGNPTAPTASPGDNDTTIATTAFVTAAVAAIPAAFPLLQEVTPSTTAIDFTGLPSTLRQVLLVLDDVVTSGTAQLCVRLGNSGGFISTGYTEGSTQVAPGGNSGASLSTGFSITANTASNTFKGGVYIVRVNTNDWVAYGVIGLVGGSVIVAGRLALTGTLTQLRLTTTGGSVTFSGAKVSLFGA